jgi:hypothetical protein
MSVAELKIETEAEGFMFDRLIEELPQSAAHRAAFFDGAEIFLEVAVVFCSIALLTGALRFLAACVCECGGGTGYRCGRRSRAVNHPR